MSMTKTRESIAYLVMLVNVFGRLPRCDVGRPYLDSGV